MTEIDDSFPLWSLPHLALIVAVGLTLHVRSGGQETVLTLSAAITVPSTKYYVLNTTPYQHPLFYIFREKTCWTSVISPYILAYTECFSLSQTHITHKLSLKITFVIISQPLSSKECEVNVGGINILQGEQAIFHLHLKKCCYHTVR